MNKKYLIIIVVLAIVAVYVGDCYSLIVSNPLLEGLV